MTWAKSIGNGELPWLSTVPDEFRARLRDLVQGDQTIAASSYVALAKHSLDIDRLIQFDRSLTKAGDRIDGPELVPVKLALLVQGTTDYIAPAIRVSAVRHGVLPELYVPPFGQGITEILDPDSGLHRFGPEVVLVAETAQSLGLDKPFVDPDLAEARVGSAIDQVRKMVEQLRGAGVATVVLQSIALPADPWLGQLDGGIEGSPASLVAAFNKGLIQVAKDNAAILFDVDMLAGFAGRAAWHDPTIWHQAKVPFSLDFVPLYAEKFAHILRALKGRSSKCLVLDLDNTCWGGVVGDDGVDGIRIGQGSALGEAYLAIQNYALSLKARGIVLAVCSKNDDAIAKEPFEKHPDMALRLDDIAVFIANWTDKATNLAQIAATLNIGLDALVFLDDNPAERARVRQELPMVAVPEVGDDPAFYPAMLSHGGYFETLGLSADDFKRAQQYQENAKRKIAMEAIGNYEDYLVSLEMKCTLQPFDDIGRTRIAQLTNKTNQFNLTTRRYGEAEIARMQADPDHFTLQVRLADKFGDNGMISVAIFRKETREWICDTWLMSCRVLKRRVEEAVLCAVVEKAREEGVERIVGEYIPTAKNGMVADHFGALGFTKIEENENGHSKWALDIGDYEPPVLPMQISLQSDAPLKSENA